MNALSIVIPTANHRACVFHIKEFFFPLQTKPDEKIWKASKALKRKVYEGPLAEISEMNHEAALYLSNIPLQPWTLVEAAPCFGHVTANMAESMNSWIIQERPMELFDVIHIVRKN
ncbi:hypothetical protein CCR75_004827 [Bremia lactucae]|uniref:MULE transposase domain-containing protein n=1 Tax=Bremia lactucae TaxID=4779 RepID=A0A976FIN6_BRELC|nr:hypothetical protein CCR75_004827 [Bremia lactucae]